MSKSESKEIKLLGKYQGEIDNMILEVEGWKTQLRSLNEGLLEASRMTCSEYGDRMLENTQSKLFYFQRVLRMSSNALEEYQKELLAALKDSVSMMPKIKEYQEYCYESSRKISGKLSVFKKQTLVVIERNRGTSKT